MNLCEWNTPWQKATQAGIALWVGLAGTVLAGAVRADDIRQVPLISNDIAYSPSTGQIYASVPGSAGVVGNGNSLTAIDPVAGSVGASVFVGSEPDQLAVSDDGQFVYIALDGSSSVGRFDTATGAEGLTFSIGSPLSVEDMAVLPGLPHSVAVSKQDRRYSPHGAGTYVFDDGVARANPSFGSNTITAATSTRLYGYLNEVTSFTFNTLNLDDTGFIAGDSNGNVISGFGLRIRYDNGLVFGSNGVEIDPMAQTVVGSFPGAGGGAPFVADAKINRLFVLTGSGSTLTLRAFDTQEFLEVGNLAVPGVSGGAGSLVRWGANGLAFRTSGGQLFLIRTSLITAAQPSSLTLSPDTLVGGDSATGTLILAAPAPSSGVTILLSTSDTTDTSVPASLTVPAGQTSATFAITTQPVAATTPVTISASSSGTRLSTVLTVAAPSFSHLLWTNTDGSAAIWTIRSDGSITSTPAYGPIPQWNAKSIADGTDGKTRLLWTRQDGQNAVWTVNTTDGTYTSTPGYGPYDGGRWNVASLAVGPDNRTHLQWKHSPDGQSSVWTVAAGSFTSTPAFGPYGPWTAGAMAVGGDSLSRLVWGDSNGRFSVWSVAGDGSFTSTAAFGPIQGWTTSVIAGGPDLDARLLLNRSDGAMAVWTVDGGGFVSSTPLYGPISGWTCHGLAVGPDALSRVLWNRSDGASAVWTVNADGSIASTPLYGPISGWTAVSLSVGP